MRGWRVRARVCAVRAAARAEAAEEDASPGWELDLDTDPLRWLPAAWDADPDLTPGSSSSPDPGEGNGGHVPAQQSASERDSQLGPGSQGVHVREGHVDWRHVPAAESSSSRRALDEAGRAAAAEESCADLLMGKRVQHQVSLQTQQCMQRTLSLMYDSHGLPTRRSKQLPSSDRQGGCKHKNALGLQSLGAGKAMHGQPNSAVRAVRTACLHAMLTGPLPFQVGTISCKSLLCLQDAVEALMAEWGFRDRATAEAALRARDRRLHSHRTGALRRRLEQARQSLPLCCIALCCAWAALQLLLVSGEVTCGST